MGIGLETKNEKWRTKNDLPALPAGRHGGRYGNEKIKMVSKHNLPNNGCWSNDKHYLEEFSILNFYM